jgi:hypothetical protein
VSEPSSIVVVIAHPYGNIEVSLAEWIATGPGPRLFVRPIAAKDRATGQALPLEVIPLQYRNDEDSIRLIVEGQLVDPWKRDRQELERGLQEMQGLH